MRFNRQQRYEFTDTARKRAALERKRRLEREALPLFADDIAREQAKISPDEVMAHRREAWIASEIEWRQRRADNWRRARARLASYGSNVRPSLLAYWQRCRWPADPSYLLSMLHMFDTGRLDLDAQPAPQSWSQAS